MSPLTATSNLNTSNLNTTNLNNSLNPNTLNTSRTLHVPTPKLWYREKVFTIICFCSYIYLYLSSVDTVEG